MLARPVGKPPDRQPGPNPHPTVAPRAAREVPVRGLRPRASGAGLVGRCQKALVPLPTFYTPRYFYPVACQGVSLVRLHRLGSSVRCQILEWRLTLTFLDARVLGALSDAVAGPRIRFGSWA